ncbi:CMP/dCMP deaminase, zinc-binding protein [Candidatus Uzinura diaspidicola str. ASNER]|uniref:CMP/dCMP deaminase, zinc-binding protein n=1 Tax=Candidatus Uzinura diaspidicola str. ASNER TaxID=1133592 RepID=L7VMQ9_9FLAO|nr:CMP/dCMP deaminase, zinc-binding protein [Candidatus Uzinura diaspidicola str. ASNER]
MKFLDEYFMRQALKEAIYAFEKNEIPVGAIIGFKNNIIAQAHNLTKKLKDVSAHAELQVIGAAELYLKGKYKSLKECSLYVTLEPCIMCSGAILLAKLGSLVFGASNISFNKVIHNIESSLLLESFFKKRRKYL